MEAEDLQFFKHIRKLQKYLNILDKVKSQGPYLSLGLEPLTKYIKEKVFDGNMSTGGISMSTLTSLSNISAFRHTNSSELGGMIDEH